MLAAFGFPSTVVGFSPCIHLINPYGHMQALGEADAKLAWLSKEGFIDAVANKDSDLVVLGTVVVLQK